LDSRFKLHGSLPRKLLDDGPRGNERLTAGLAILLLILLAIEGATVLVIRSTLPLHVFVGVLLLPVVAAKLASTGYRLFRYYAASKPYVRRGPPAVIPRLLGPVVAGLTMALFGTGVGLLFVPPGQSTLLFLHKASFVLWFAAMTVHVLIHLADLPQLGLADWRKAAHRVTGVARRRELLLATLLVGTVLGLAALPLSNPWEHWLTGFGAVGG